MNFPVDKVAAEILEIASEQRLSIILNLKEKKFTISEMAKHLEATVPEVHRNFSRLVKSGFIIKNNDSTYSLTVFGTTVYHNLSWIIFLSENQKYFLDHNYHGIPQKFVHRIGELSNSTLINGYARVLEKWNHIYKNANKFIYNTLVDVSYGSDLIDTLLRKLTDKVKIQSIFSETAIIPEERKKVLEEKNFKQFITDDILKRRMKKEINAVIVLNESEAGLCFQSNKGDPDLSKMFYSNDASFHEWCLDYFNYMWNDSGSFQESKLSLKS